MSTMSKSPFCRKASNNEGGDYELPPTGNQPATLVGMIDLGTHSFNYQGKTTEAHKVLFAWELTDPDERTKDGSPHVVVADYTISLNKKAKMRAMLEGWVGRTFRDDEEFDPADLMGSNCILNLTEGLTANGKKFVEVSGVSKPMKGYSMPPSVLTQFVFAIDDNLDPKQRPELPDWLPRLYGKDVRDEIMNSVEWSKLSPF